MSALAAGLSSQYLSPNSGLARLSQQVAPQGLNDYYWATPPVDQGHLFQETESGHRALINVKSLHSAFQRSLVAVSTEIYNLQRMYVFVDNRIGPFLEGHRALRTALRQAIDPLKATFGSDIIVNLEISRDEDGSETLYAVAISRADARTASQALHHFMEGWWLQRMNAATTDLAFVYKLV